MSETYHTSYTAFCGADAMIVLNGEVVTEVSSVSWELKADIFPNRNTPYQGVIETCVFGSQPIIDIRKTPIFQLEIQYRGESSDMMLIEKFMNAKFTRYSAERSVDDVLLTDFYEFEATDIIREYKPVESFMSKGGVNHG